MTQIKSALGLGLRPSAHILRLKEPRSGWTAADHALAEAYQILQDETCPECGNAVWVCRSPNNSLIFEANWDVCQASAAREIAEKKKPTPKPGEFAYVRPKMLFGKPMVKREEYFAALAEERAIHEKAANNR
jgi:hypothetical protein